MDQCQPHENSWTACQSSQVVNWVKTNPDLVLTQTNPDLVLTQTNPDLVLTQLTTWDDWQAVQEFSWGWHWSTFKYIGC